MGILIEDSDFSLSSVDEDILESTKQKSALHENPANERSSRRVTFDSYATCYDVMGLDEYSNDELEASFFTVDDMIRMKEIARAEARLLDSGLLTETRIRGLEHRTREGLKNKRQYRVGAYTAVFCEIEFQLEEEILDEDSIASAYGVYSKKAAEEAYELAKKDAFDAMNIYRKSYRGRVILNKTLINKLTPMAA